MVCKRTAIASFRFNKNELWQLDRLVKIAGYKKRSDYVRDVCLGKINPKILDKETAENYIKM